jgi:enamine deaminase RidA (YjgF/YER057c/UK114 family)
MDRAAMDAVRAAFVQAAERRARYPAMALVQVVRLVEAAAGVEIEATAVVPR